MFLSNCPQVNMLKMQTNNLKIGDHAFLKSSLKLNLLPSEVKDMALI